MRKVAAIILLLVFVLYHLGYYGIYMGRRYQLEQSWQHRIDHNKPENQQLLQASIPIALPYSHDQADFQPASGTVEIEGKFYRIVKQRYAKDTVYILYVKDVALGEWHQSFQEWLASLTQKPASQKDSAQWWKTVIKDIMISAFAGLSTLSAVAHVGICCGNYLMLSYEVTMQVPSPPPEV